MEEYTEGKRRNYKKYWISVNFYLEKFGEKKERLLKQLEKAESNQNSLKDSEDNLLELFTSLKDTEERWLLKKLQCMNLLENQKLETFTKAYIENLEETRDKLFRKIGKIENSKEPLQNSKIDAKISSLKFEMEKTTKMRSSQKIKLGFFKKCRVLPLSFSEKIKQSITDHQTLEKEVLLKEVKKSCQNFSTKSERLKLKIQKQKKESTEKFDKDYENEEKIEETEHNYEKLRLEYEGSQNKIEYELMDLKVKFLERKLECIDSALVVYKEKTSSENLLDLPTELEFEQENKKQNSKHAGFDENIVKELSIVLKEYDKVISAFFDERINHKKNKLLIRKTIRGDFNEDLMVAKEEEDNTEEEKCEQKGLEILEVLKKLLIKTEEKIEKKKKVLEELKLNKKMDIMIEDSEEDSVREIIKLAKNCEEAVKEYFSLRIISLALGELALMGENLKMIDKAIEDLLKKKSEINSIIGDF